MEPCRIFRQILDENLLCLAKIPERGAMVSGIYDDVGIFYIIFSPARIVRPLRNLRGK